MSRIMFIGAHPDDCETVGGGLAALCAGANDQVCLVSMTNGESGHHLAGGAPLVRRRQQEAALAASRIGAESVVMDNPDGELVASLEVRRQLITVIRGWQPDVLVTHRPNDYHPDHRNTGLTVMDAAYMLTVPNVSPGTPALKKDPVILYASDRFVRPYPLQPDLIFDIGPVIEAKLDLLDAYDSQYYEWIPAHDGKLAEVPSTPTERREWLRRDLDGLWRRDAERFRERLIEWYGPDRGSTVEFAEAYEVCEYGAQLSDERARQMFPF
jgi:LmbE family N-acetylglucosaminyl deacetylase